MLCDDLEGWGGGGEWEEDSKERGIYVFTQLIHDVVQQKIAQRCKVIIFQ